MTVTVTARCVFALCLLLLATLVSGQEVFDPPDPTDDDAQTGVLVGARIPEFRATDQNGQERDFESLKGPKGLLLLFHRSADW